MSSYIALARKWRSQQFTDIVGQSAVVRTLMNAVKTKRVHHAYLFTGSRGIGKTSIARIFAKLIRCENPIQENDLLHSCDQCSNCNEITQGSSVDVIEIDGASNNGVDAVRDIRDAAKFYPSSGQKKIYIIDEVHMLTSQAFNALLKTLEEPPEHILFILATTEPHKIPATILSRCQRFDFKRMTSHQIQDRLALILNAEGITAESGALALISRASEGSMRDALSLLDQVISFSGQSITLAHVRESIGLVESETIFQLIKGILSRDTTLALKPIQSAYEAGHDLKVLARNVLELLHAVILFQVSQKRDSTAELTEEEWAEVESLAGLRPLEELELIFQVFHHGIEWIARSPQPKLILDVLAIKTALAETLQPVATAPLVSANGTDISSSASLASSPIAEPESNPNPKNTQPVADPSTPQTASTPPITFQSLLSKARQTRPHLASLLEHASHFQNDETPAGRKISLTFSKAQISKAEQVQSKIYQSALAQILGEMSSDKITLDVLIKEDAQESLAEKRERNLREREDHLRTVATQHPIIQEAKALFGGELSPIEILEEGGNGA